jgi:hypothetical protein
MTEITKIKIALLESDKELEDDKSDFNLKYSATLNIKEILEKNINNVLDYDFDEFIEEILNNIFEDLMSLTKKENIIIDYIGLWIYYDNSVIDNSIKLSILDDIERYGADINPLYEFYKMTLLKKEEVIN